MRPEAPTEVRGFIAALKALRHPKSEFSALTHGLERLPKNALSGEKQRPQGLKPQFWRVFAARLKPSPFKTRELARAEAFQTYILAAEPFQNWRSAGEVEGERAQKLGRGAVPAGLVFLLAPVPGTSVPGSHMSPLRGWIRVVQAYLFVP